MSSFAKISIRFAADLKQFSSEMQNAERSMKKFGQNMTKIGSGLSLGVTLPLIGLGAASVKAASDAEETSSKFDTVFRDIASAAKASAEALRDSYGLSSTSSKQLLSDTGDLLTGFGFSQAAALDLSTDVNKLAVDLASFTNFSGGAEGASQALTKALLGERESVKSLGISILEADVKAKVLENTQKGLTFESERQAKAFATLQLAQEQSKNAIGDYARTSDSFANKMRLLKARLEDVSVQFGEILLPYVTKLASFVGKLIDKFSDLSPVTKKIIVVVAAFAAAIGPLLVIMGVLMTSVIPGIIAALPALGAAFTALTGPIGLLIAAIAGIAFMVYKHWDRIKAEMVSLQNYFIDLYNESVVFRIAIESIIFTFSTLWSTVKFVFSAIYTVVENAALFILNSFKNIGAGIKAALTGNISGIGKAFKDQSKLMATSFGGTIKDLDSEFKAFSNEISGNFSNAIDNVIKRKKIAFVKENIDTTAIKEAVEEVNLDRPVGEGTRKQISTLDPIAALPIIETSPFDFIVEKMPAQVDFMNEQQLRALDNAIQFNEGFTAILEDVAQNTVIGFGQLLAGMAAGTAGIADFGSLIVGAFADIAIKVGELAIKIGLTLQGVQAALASINPVLAIAAGVALVALGTFLKSSMSNVASGGGSPTPFADGGIVYGPTNALIGEYSGARSNPEVVAPLDKLKNLLGDAGGKAAGRLEGEFKVKGQDLLLVLNSAQAYKSRRG